MPTIRIQFPEHDSPKTLAITGDRISIGRRADNTIQVVDRMVSAFHAELILEGDHYRIHDLGSTNGTFVNGEPITDYHLREACKIGFGPVECEFSPEVAPGVATVKLPTRVEVEATRRQSEELQGRLAIVEKELATLRQVQAAGEDEAGTNLLKGELQRLVQERTEMQEAAQKKQREFEALKTELARMNRDRQNLQDALSRANAEIAHLKAIGTSPSASAADVAAAQTQKIQQPERKAVLPTNLPKPTSVAADETVVSPQPKATPAQPAQPAVPRATPVGVPKVTARPIGTPSVSGAPRPIAKPSDKPAAPAGGPSGTQRISLGTGQSAPATPQNKPLPGKLPAAPLPRPGSLPKPSSVAKPEEHSAS